MRRGLGRALPMPQLYLVPQGPYLGLLKEWSSLFVLDVRDLALLYLERGSQPGDPRRRLSILLTSHSHLRPGLPGCDGPLGPQHIPEGAGAELRPEK